jgi:polysaccharide biosynthesis protein PslH
VRGRPRTVFIAPVLPTRVGNGLAMRMGLFLEALTRVSEVTVLVVPVAGTPPIGVSLGRELGVSVQFVDISGREETSFQVIRHLREDAMRVAALRSYGKPTLARFLSSSVLKEVADFLRVNRPDLVHIGRSYLAPCVNLGEFELASLDVDEDDFASYNSQASLARRAGSPYLADWLAAEAQASESFLRMYGIRFNRAFVSNPDDQTPMRRRHPQLQWSYVANAVSIPRFTQRQEHNDPTLLFVGSLSYGPNRDGILWFVRSVLPRLAPLRPKVLIVGADPPAAVRATGKHPRIAVLGGVDDLNGLYRRATLAIAPLHAGGGTRIKLLEAAAHQVATIATPLARGGIGWRSDVGGWIGEGARNFAEACAEALSDGRERKARAERGRRWVMRHHDRATVIHELASSFGGLFARAI